MIKVIYKYPLFKNNMVSSTINIVMPENAEILYLEIDNKTNMPCIWALVNPRNKLVVRYFEIFGTGLEIEYNSKSHKKYIGTFQYLSGQFIMHVFEKIKIR